MDLAAGQRLQELGDPHPLPHMIDRHHVFDPLHSHRLAVDVEHAADHLDAVAGQPDQALDVVGLVVPRQLEDDDVAALGIVAEDAAVEQRQPEADGVLAVSIGEFGHEQIIADQQRRDHRARGNVEGLVEEGADAEGDDHRIDKGAHRLAQPGLSGIGFALGIGLLGKHHVGVAGTGIAGDAAGTASRITNAWASGYSSLRLR